MYYICRMKNAAQTLLFFLTFTFFNASLMAQSLSVDIPTVGDKRKTFHYSKSGESLIRYLEFNEFVIRQEGNTVQFLDENLQEVDRLELPEKGKTVDYSIEQGDQHLYMIQKYEPEERSKDTYKFTLFVLDLYDFQNYESHDLSYSGSIQTAMLHLLDNQAYIVLYQDQEINRIMTTGSDGNSLREVEYKHLYNEHSENGRFQSFFVHEDEILLTIIKQKENETVTQVIHLNPQFEVTKEKTSITNHENRETVIIDEDGEETASSSRNWMDAFEDYPPYSITVNNEKIWIKYVYDAKGFMPSLETTLISRDEQNINLDLKDHLKKEMKASGFRKSQGMQAPIIYADPINNSIIVQYWKIIYVNGIKVESFVFFLLDENFNLRNTYKTSLSRYPLAFAGDQQQLAFAMSMFEVNPTITFTIDKKPKHWEGKSGNGKNNAFDFAFSNYDRNGLYSIVNANNRQYLFVDFKDGSTKGYMFK